MRPSFGLIHSYTTTGSSYNIVICLKFIELFLKTIQYTIKVMKEK